MRKALKLTGEDKHIMGITTIDGVKIFVYDRESLFQGRCALWLEDDPTLSEQEVWADVNEDYLFNTVDAWLGDTTPAFIDTDTDAEVAADLFDGELGRSPVGFSGFLGIAERCGMEPCYAFSHKTNYRPTEGYTVMYVDIETDLSKWLDK